MIRAKIVRNYAYPDLNRQTPGLDGAWENVQFSETFNDEVDFVIILNHNVTDISIKARKGGVWIFLQEPPDPKNVFYTRFFRFADRVYSGYGTGVKNGIGSTTTLPWHINKTYSELKSLHYSSLQKRDAVSWITSNNNMFPGHQVRLDFMQYLRDNNFSFDLFGRGFNPIADKFDGLAGYKYSIAVENYFDKDYWTEKIQDCFLSWSMPIYFGCTNMADYFPAGSFIQVDLADKKTALEKIRAAIAEDLWTKNIDAIAEARRLILDKYQFFPATVGLINAFLSQNPNAKMKRYYIPASGEHWTDKWKARIPFSGR
jgi:hypothetical protein